MPNIKYHILRVSRVSNWFQAIYIYIIYIYIKHHLLREAFFGQPSAGPMLVDQRRSLTYCAHRDSKCSPPPLRLGVPCTEQHSTLPEASAIKSCQFNQIFNPNGPFSPAIPVDMLKIQWAFQQQLENQLITPRVPSTAPLGHRAFRLGSRLRLT